MQYGDMQVNDAFSRRLCNGLMHSDLVPNRTTCPLLWFSSVLLCSELSCSLRLSRSFSVVWMRQASWALTKISPILVLTADIMTGFRILATLVRRR